MFLTGSQINHKPHHPSTMRCCLNFVLMLDHRRVSDEYCLTSLSSLSWQYCDRSRDYSLLLSIEGLFAVRNTIDSAAHSAPFIILGLHPLHEMNYGRFFQNLFIKRLCIHNFYTGNITYKVHTLYDYHKSYNNVMNNLKKKPIHSDTENRRPAPFNPLKGRYLYKYSMLKHP